MATAKIPVPGGYEIDNGKAVPVNINDCVECCTCVEICPENAINAVLAKTTKTDNS